MTDATSNIEKSDIDWLQRRLREHIANFKNSREWYRTRARWFGVAGAVLGGLTTVLVALQQLDAIVGPVKSVIGIIALISSATIAVISSLDNIFEPKKLWIRYTKTLNGLYELQDRLEYTRTKNTATTSQIVDKIYNDLQSLLNENNTDWVSARDVSNKSASQNSPS